MKMLLQLILTTAMFLADISIVSGEKSLDMTGETTLSGKITDKTSGKGLSGVTVYLPDLRTGTISDKEGNYKIENLPLSKVLVQVSFIGYELIAENIDLTITSVMSFTLEESVIELREIVVTGLSQAAEKNRTPTPINTIPAIQLLQNTSINIIEIIARQPGVSQITTGAGISKPVIRGLGYNRVVTVNDGVRQEGQQWGDEHGIEIDGFGVNKVEILKGPASLTYGSDAMAGVINMLSAPTLPEGQIMGHVLATYQTNNGLLAYSANIAGNKKGIIWNVRYSNKMAHAYKNKYDGYVLNSGFKENALSGVFGLNKSWGYSHLYLSAYNLTPGIVEGERDSITGEFVKPVAHNDSIEDYSVATEEDYKSYNPITPFQKIHHYKAAINNNFIIGDGSIKTTLGFQQNQRQEYADILDIGNYGLYFLLNTINYDARYLLPERNKFNFSFGGNGMQQTSQNKGIEFLIPDYSLFDIGVFAVMKKSYNKLDFSAGIRYDSRNVKGQDLYLNARGEKVETPDSDTYLLFNQFNSTFTGISGSIGATYQFSEHIYTKLNFSRGFRSPNIAEISANGVHEGSINYIIGDPDLKAEHSIQSDLSFGYNNRYISFEVDLFSNNISNYIFPGKLKSSSGGDSLSDGYSTYKYTSGMANLFGGEVSLDIHPYSLSWLHFENTFSYVQALQSNQPDSTKYLPFTPAPLITSELKATKKKLGKYLANAFIKAEILAYFRQDKFYAANGAETATPGYTLINFGGGTDIMTETKTLCSFYFSINNLADIAWQSHLSRLKYAGSNNQTGRTGVYNMGRNFSFKIIVPINLKSKKV